MLQKRGLTDSGLTGKCRKYAKCLIPFDILTFPPVVLQCSTLQPIFVKDLIVATLVIEEDRPAHIAKHQVSIDEVVEVLTGDYVYFPGRENRWLVIGTTETHRVLTIVLGERPDPNTYGLVTARSADKKERRLYAEYAEKTGGEEAA